MCGVATGSTLHCASIATGTPRADGERGFGGPSAQALYFCQPFRERLLQHAESLRGDSNSNESLLNELAALFQYIHSQKKKTGVVRRVRLCAV